MLILRRRAGESLLIGPDVEIEILDSGPWGVKLGIRAPKEVTILRKELQMTREANCQAAREVRIADLPKSLRFFSDLNSHKHATSR